MNFVDAGRVHQLLPFPMLVDALAEAHRGPEPIVERSMLVDPDASSGRCFLNLPAWQPGTAFGIKMITVQPDNRARSLPSVNAVYQLFDGETGVPTLTIEGESLTFRKTAADSALGARFLAREDAATLLMVGAGALAPYIVRAHVALRASLARVLVWNRTHAGAEALAEQLSAQDIAATATTDLESAVREADLISCATMATEPLVRGEWLKPGVHVDLVGGFTPQMRECDDGTMTRSSLFVDARQSTIGCVGDITIPMACGAITEEDVLADLYQLSRGEHPGRRSPEEITVFKNGGGAHLDLFTAVFLERQLAAESASATN